MNKKVLAEIQTDDGLIEVLNYQADMFLVAQEKAEQGDANDLARTLAAECCLLDGKKMTKEQVFDLYKTDLNDILSAMDKPLKNVEKVKVSAAIFDDSEPDSKMIQATRAVLGVSGETVLIKRPKVSDDKKAQMLDKKKPGMALVSVCVRFGEKNEVRDVIDIQTMSGPDFMALTQALNENPS